MVQKQRSKAKRLLIVRFSFRGCPHLVPLILAGYLKKGRVYINFSAQRVPLALCQAPIVNAASDNANAI